MNVLLLSGGGSNAGFQAGVIKQLTLAGQKFDLVVGTSAGAVNATAFAQLGADGLYEHWKNTLDDSGVTKKIPWYKLLFASGLMTNDPLRERFEKNALPFKYAEAVVCFCDLETGKTQYVSSKDFSPKDFAKWVASSGAVPGIVEPIDGKYCDGGVSEVAPLKYAIDRGATQITVVTTEPIEKDKFLPYKATFPKALNNLGRGVEMMLHNVLLGNLKVTKILNDDPRYRSIAIQLYAPTEPLGDWKVWDPARIKANLAKGLQAVPRPLP
jgi:predicted acylesterase/phospholipase RssA